MSQLSLLPKPSQGFSALSSLTRLDGCCEWVQEGCCGCRMGRGRWTVQRTHGGVVLGFKTITSIEGAQQ